MSRSLQKKLDLFAQEVQTEEFLHKRGLANEVPFFIFDYHPREELILRAALDRIIQRLPIDVLHINMYELMLEQFSDVGIETLLNMEQEEGTGELYDAMMPSLEPGALAQDIANQARGKQLVLITRIGSVYPLIRANSILHNLGDLKVEVPVVIFYPGSYSERGLMMFNQFPTQSYYRAFAIQG